MKVILNSKNGYCGLTIKNILISEVQNLVESKGVEVSFCAEPMSVCLEAKSEFSFDEDFQTQVKAIEAKQIRPLLDVLLDDFILVVGLGLLAGSLAACVSVMFGVTILTALKLTLTSVGGAIAGYGFFSMSGTSSRENSNLMDNLAPVNPTYS